MHLLGASRLQTEQGLEVKWYPAQTGVCIPVGRHQGDPLSPPPLSPTACVAEIQANRRFPDNLESTANVGDEERRFCRREMILRVPENECQHSL